MILDDRRRGAVAAWAWVGVVGAALLLLIGLGHGSLAGPPVRHPSQLHIWAEQRDAPTMAFAVIRLVAQLAAAYLLLATGAGLLARAAKLPRLIAATDIAAVPIVRHIVAGIIGAGLTASVGALSVLPTAGATPAARAPAAVQAGSPSSPVPTDDRTVRIRRLPNEASVALERLPDDEGTATMTATPEPTSATRPPSAWTVEPGQNFWHQAEAILASAWGRQPTEAETELYWKNLVNHNATRLAVPGEPDLIYPGQVFELPPPPPG